MIEGLLIGLSTVLTLHNLLFVAAGCLTGMMIGLLPGLGPISAIALMIPISYNLDPTSGMILLTAIHWLSKAMREKPLQSPPMPLFLAAPLV